MRFKRNYLRVIKRKMDWFLSRFKPLTIHTEVIMIDKIWDKIKVKNGVKKWYVMTPVNLDYFKSNFNIKMSKEELSKIIKTRYKEMLNQGQTLELHIHLSQLMENITYEEQYKLFWNSIKWMKEELNITPTEFVPGWWAYNKDTLKICELFNLKMIYEKDYDFIHDFQL